jgi:hypothetical protein
MTSKVILKTLVLGMTGKRDGVKKLALTEGTWRVSPGSKPEHGNFQVVSLNREERVGRKRLSSRWQSRKKRSDPEENLLCRLSWFHVLKT